VTPSILTASGLLRGVATPLGLIVLKATVILIAALGVTIVMRRAAAGSRHLVWLITLVSVLLIPALAVWAPLPLRILPSDLVSVSAIASTAAPQAPAVSAAVRAPSPAQRTAATAPSLGTRARNGAGTEAALTRVARMNPFVVLLGIWAAIALASLGSLAVGAVSLRRVVAASRALESADWLGLLWEVCDRLGLDRAPRLRRSSDIAMPFACGLLRPTIVLPADSDDWSLDRRRAVLLHELAHIRRRDLVGHTLGRIACAAYWFHPLVWTAAGRLRSESERACDDLALACGTRPADYAEHLLDIVVSVRRDRTPTIALAMARRSEFEGRMLAILDPGLHRSALSHWKSGALVGALAAMAIVVGAAAPMSRTASQAEAQAAPAATARVVRQVAPQPRQQVAHDSAGANRDNRSSAPDADDAAFAAAVGRFATHTATSVVDGLDRGLRNLGVNVDVSSSAAESRVLRSAGLADDAATDPAERVKLLVRVLASDTSASLRHVAAWGLSRYADSPTAATGLAAALQHDASASVRETAAWSLARGGDESPSTVAALSSALLHDSSDSVRATSAWALGEIGSGEAAAALATAVTDRAANVRTRALWALGRLSPEHAPNSVVLRLTDADPEVRELAAWTLNRIADPASVPALQSALRSERDSSVQIADIRALGAMGDAAVDALRPLLESPDPRVKSVVVRVLASGRASGPWPWPWPDPRPFP
jgi:beta-lactamase regulating signal transducer with metallopeptidase domain/HEAT repeat protein